MEIFFRSKKRIFILTITTSLIALFLNLFIKKINVKENEYQETHCPDSSFSIAYFGQSNSANSVNKISKFNFPDNLYQYNWKDKRCYKYKEPLLGATGKKGNSITPFAISLANAIFTCL